MAVNTISLDGDWLLKDFAHKQGERKKPFDAKCKTNDWLTTCVPGDIHPTLEKAGRLPENMFAGMNVEECRWTGEREWWFRRDFDLSKKDLRQKAELVFEGIDLFGTVWINGQCVGETENSFREYRFDVTKHLKAGQKNTVVVRVAATLKLLDAKPWQKYFACFNSPRIFARKTQCQFSWDWAPHLPALGIWKSVRLECFDSGRVMETAIRTWNDGKVMFHMALDERTYRQDLDQSEKGTVKVSSKGQETMKRPTGDFVVEVTGPFNTTSKAKPKTVRHKMSVEGHKSFCILNVPDPKLWWPTGAGEQPLYHYKIKLIRNGKTHHQTEGRFAFREVKLVEEPIGSDKLSFQFEINGTPIFCKGANWVPASCFPGAVTKQRYRHLVRLAQDGNFNMLRVWGGGTYESDHFYDACDELGVMVWQDFMFACSDIPDDDPSFVENVIPELEFQVKRLRNHPSLVYWCGGNEKTGSAGFRISYGERMFHVIARGVCNDLDPTREYRPASPHSLTDLGNDKGSGDSHGGCYEKAFVAGALPWREKMDLYSSVFNSEFGYHGPTRYESMTKFVDEDQIWPLGEQMEYHVQDNPYNPIPETFAQVQAKMAEALVGDITDGESFVRCASTFHGELLRAEIEHHRRRMWDNAGAMFWMFNDCWPCASWSVVDYYAMPKPAYYLAKRAFAPLITVVVEQPKGYDVYVVNDSLKPVNATLKFGQGHVVKKPVWAKQKKVKVAANSSLLAVTIPNSQVRKASDTYLFAKLAAGTRELASSTFFHKPWRETEWLEPTMKVAVGACKPATSDHPSNGKQYVTKVKVSTKAYARMVHIDGVEGEGVLLSDNFFDMMPGESKTVEVRSDRKINPAKISLRNWMDRWD